MEVYGGGGGYMRTFESMIMAERMTTLCERSTRVYDVTLPVLT